MALKSVAVLVRMTECGEDTKAGQPLGDGEESNVAPSDRWLWLRDSSTALWNFPLKLHCRLRGFYPSFLASFSPLLGFRSALWLYGCPNLPQFCSHFPHRCFPWDFHVYQVQSWPLLFKEPPLAEILLLLSLILVINMLLLLILNVEFRNIFYVNFVEIFSDKEKKF